MVGLHVETLDIGCWNTSCDFAIFCAFALGFFICRRKPFSRHHAKPNKFDNGPHNGIENSTMSLVVAMEADYITMGNCRAAIHIWRATEDCVLTPMGTLWSKLKALHRNTSDNSVGEIAGHMSLPSHLSSRQSYKCCRSVQSCKERLGPITGKAFASQL